MLTKIFFPAIVFLLISCGDNVEKKVVTETETATAFIKNIQDDNFKAAEQYIYKEDVNLQMWDRFKQFYHTKGKSELEQLKKSDIIINEIQNISDTLAIVNYSNSYKKEIKNKVKLLRINGKWQIDFKYTVSENL